MFALKPFCALNAVEFSQAREVFSGFGAFVVCEMLGRFEVGVDLIEITVRDVVSIYIYIYIYYTGGAQERRSAVVGDYEP